MHQDELKTTLDRLIALPAETECVEFKEANQNFDFKKIGRYFSALSNEANLKKMKCSWLIFGVKDKPRKIIGSKYRENRTNLDNLKSEVAKKTTNNITFLDIHELLLPEGRIIMFEIPPAPLGIPIAWEGHYYGRDGEDLVPLNIQELDEIRSQNQEDDWSNEVIPSTSIADLDDKAIEFLKSKLAEVSRDKKYLELSTANLLARLQLLRDGLLTNTCLLFLGNKDVAEKLLPEISQITWRYEDEKNEIKERIKFSSPLLLSLYEVEKNIHRFNTFLTDYDLFRVDIKQYDDKAIEELLVNSLVHRDWTINLWVEVIQTPIGISFRNPGLFRANLENALKSNLRPPYVNQRMADFFQKLNLMEKEGGGLQVVYISQLRKGTRILPKFHTTRPPRVDFMLMGKVENVAFAKLVLSKQDIDLEDLILIDKIASGQNKYDLDIPSAEAEKLKEYHYIEIRGSRYKKCFISENLSRKIGQRGKYMVERGLSQDQKIQHILNTIEKYGQIKLIDTRNMFENFSESSMKYLLGSVMIKRGLIKRVKPSINKRDWYYIKA